MKGEKPWLRATVNFSIERARPREAYVKTSLVSEETLGNIQSQEGNENVKKNNRFDKQNNNVAHGSRFFVHFYAVFARLQRENA